MNSKFSKCFDDWGNLKDNALNIAYNIGKKEGLRKGKKQGRADKYQEITSEYMLLTEKQIAEIRADAIEEFGRICEEARSHNFGVCDADFVIDVIKAKVKEQLKEQTE